MLVLSRREGEFIRIGDNIDVVVNRLGGGRVVIGVEAPTETKVVRGELLSDAPAQATATAENDAWRKAPFSELGLTAKQNELLSGSLRLVKQKPKGSGWTTSGAKLQP